MRDVALLLAGALAPIARGPGQQLGGTRSCKGGEKRSLGSQAGFVERIDRVPLVKDFELICIQARHPLAGGLRGNLSFFR